MTDKDIELCIDAKDFWIPKKVDYAASAAMFAEDMSAKMRETLFDLRSKGWVFYAVNHTRGHCHYLGKIITIPVWALIKSVKYKQWYISHEMAHAVAGGRAKHGPVFMAALKSICPEDAIHFELGYKPRHASNAGIVHPDSLAF